MRIIHALTPLAALAFTLPAAAQTPPATPAPTQAPITRVVGEIVSITDASMTIRTADGKTAAYALAPNWMLFTARAIPASAIKPGDFVATTNTNVGDASGRAVELRVYPPAMAAGGRASSYPMAEPNTMMTNAPVSEVTDNADGRVLTVTFPGGQRKILLPPTVHAVAQTPLDKSALKPGWHVSVVARPNAQGVLSVSNVQTGENGAAPPGR